MDHFRALFICLFTTMALPAVAQEFRLELPVACTIGKDCWVQQYPDHDTGPGAADYTCGGATYDGHDGTDIRTRTAEDSVAVLSAAPGTVKGRRDGMDDRFVSSNADKAAIEGKECGNGIVIDHGNGWETQYCHMRKGSLKVKTGAAVQAGTPLGEIGFSGNAQFPHVHVTVRKDNETIDPFGGPLADDCGKRHASIWSEAANAALAYVAGSVLEHGFTDREPDLASLEEKSVSPLATGRDAPAIIAYARLINLQKGDTIILILRSPAGELARNHVVLDHRKATYTLFTGKKKPKQGWPSGNYTTSVTVGSGNEVRLASEKSIQLE